MEAWVVALVLSISLANSARNHLPLDVPPGMSPNVTMREVPGE
jgi:hypothetical protein